MSRALSLLAILMFTPGCSGPADMTQATSSVPATEAISDMVGKWGVEGEVSLIVSHVGDELVFSAPENDTWRMDIDDAELDGESVSFIQRNFLHSGESHPFNGVACETVVRLVDSETMEMTMTTVHTPDPESDLLLRIE